MSVHHYQETKRTSKVFAITHQEQVREHQKTREVLSEKIGDAIAAEFEKYRIPRTQRWMRNIFFFGERRDMIMAYLLLVKPHLEAAFRNLLTDGIERFSPHYVDWLRYEFDYLVASASQEEATRHRGSSAASFDRWHYSEETMPHHSRASGRAIEESNTSSDTPEADYANLYLSAPVIAGQRAYTQTTPFGSLRIQSPRRAVKAKFKRPNNEASFTFTCGIGQSVHAIHAHFLRNAANASNPGLCAQLSVFTLAESETHYNKLFASAGVEEIDDALRRGVISPYEINREGRNLCLYVSFYIRVSDRVMKEADLHNLVCCREHTGRSARLFGNPRYRSIEPEVSSFNTLQQPFPNVHQSRCQHSRGSLRALYSRR